MTALRRPAMCGLCYIVYALIRIGFPRLTLEIDIPVAVAAALALRAVRFGGVGRLGAVRRPARPAARPARAAIAGGARKVLAHGQGLFRRLGWGFRRLLARRASRGGSWPSWRYRGGRATPRHVCHASPAMPSMARERTNMALMPTEEHREFARLSAGGNRIRTIGPAANGTAMGGAPKSILAISDLTLGVPLIVPTS